MPANASVSGYRHDVSRCPNIDSACVGFAKISLSRRITLTQQKNHISMIQTKDGTRIYYKTGAKAQPLRSPTAGSSTPMPGTARCCSSFDTATAVLQLAGAGKGDPVNRLSGMTWTDAPMTSQP